MSDEDDDRTARLEFREGRLVAVSKTPVTDADVRRLVDEDRTRHLSEG